MSTPPLGVTRRRLLAVCALLVGLAFVQDPGLLTSDTKFDLVEAPGRFLGRALDLWDPQGSLGQLQNQAYGYLWPMGPFHLLGHVIGLPGWVVQRSWLALVLCVAFVGTARLARVLGVRSDLACVVAGLAFALSPRMLTTLGPISIEAWPGALAPWVLVPLVVGSTRGSPRRAAALSALAVAMVGGVNAAATFAVLPMGVIWLLTRTPGPRRRALMLWWPFFTVLGTLWWLVPLFVMGAYSPPFLQYIETTSVTTFPTDLFDTLRGTSNWVPYVSAASRAGNDLLVHGYLPFASGVVLLVGFAGLLDRRHEHRLFLALSLAIGVLMVTAGHFGAVSGWLSGDVRTLLDGSLAPLRNVHKFDPVVRLPLVLGMALVLDGVRRPRTVPAPGGPLEDRLRRANRASVVAMTLVAVAAAAAPAFATRIAPADPVLSVPAYWHQTAHWLDAHQADGASLLVPGSTFADYVWGSPRDEPLQYLTTAAWTVRNQIPLTPPGNIRMLTAIENRFAQGEGSTGLADDLRRAGLRYLVVRNDLRRGDDVPDPVLVHQTLADSPGIRRVQTFGPQVGGGAHLSAGGVRTVINGGWQALYPAIEIYQVSGADRAGSTTAGPTTVVGGPEDLIDLADEGVIGPGATVLASDVPERRRTGPLARGPLVLTDGLRAREDFYPRIHDSYSAALTPGDVDRSGNPQRDYLTPGQDAWSTRVRLEGAHAVSASSSGSDADALGGSDRGQLPYAAVDGSADSEWVADRGRLERPWWQLDLDRPTRVTRVRLRGGASATASQEVRVVTDRGSSRTYELGPDETVSVPIGGVVSRIRVEAPSASRDSRLALAEVTVPGVSVVRRLVLPTSPAAWGDPDQVVLRTDLDAREGCARVGGEVRCVPGQQRASEEPNGMQRAFTLASAQRYTPQIRVRARPGQALTDLLLAQQPVGVAASTVAVPDPRASAVAAIDGDPATTWIADAGDPRPSLSLNWLDQRRVTGIAVSGSADVAARLPTRLTLVWPRGTRTVALDGRGRASFPAIRTSRLQIRIDRSRPVRSLDFAALGSEVGVGIGELRLTGVPYLPAIPSTHSVRRACGTGPTVRVAQTILRTTVRASPAELLAGDEVAATPCGTTEAGLALRAGENDLSLASSSAFDPVSLVLSRSGAPTPTASVSSARVRHSGPDRLELYPSRDDAVVSVPQNANVGWRAVQGGHRLDPVVVDGWQQAWIVPASGTSGAVRPVLARFAPNTLYRLGLGAGLLGLLGLFVWVLVLSRRPGREEAQALDSRSASTLTMALVALAAACLVAGWRGVLVAVVALLAAAYLQDRRPDVAPWVLAAPCVVVGLVFFVLPWAGSAGWAGNEAWPAYLMLVPFAAVLGSAAVGRPRFLSRMAGPSTKR